LETHGRTRNRRLSRLHLPTPARQTGLWAEHFDRITDAIAIERKIKGWTRAKKEALIKSDWDKLVLLAKRRGGKPKRAEPQSSF
jgi:predicted GIY-YIG superfamily endonuclease